MRETEKQRDRRKECETVLEKERVKWNKRIKDRESERVRQTDRQIWKVGESRIKKRRKKLIIQREKDRT
jgi:hypothetical protein